MKNNRKISIKNQLLETKKPIKASALAEQFNVSRQTIVGDIALLRAQGEQIISTSRGYEYEKNHQFEEIVVCRHFPDQAEQEMDLIVAAGVTIKDVVIDHPIYGQLSGQMRVQSSADVKQFIQHIRERKGHLLSELTDGIHSHTLSADSLEDLKKAKEQLKKAGILYKEV
jgi:transcriptional regulator of NAD metabolism